MGGFAAKQRRRVERQSLQRPQSEFDDDDIAKQPSYHTFRNKRLPKESEQSRSTTATQQRKGRSQSNDNTNTKSPAKKKLLNKPKHLKRKIESIDGKTTDATAAITVVQEKERLLHQLEEFERKKQHLQRNKNNIRTKVEAKTIETTKVERSKVPDKKRKRNDDPSAMLPRIIPNSKTSNKDSVLVTSIASTIQQTSLKLAIIDKTNPNTLIASESKGSDIPSDTRTKLNAIHDTTGSERLIKEDEIICSNGDEEEDNDDDDDESLNMNQNTRQRGKRLRRRGATANTDHQKSSDSTTSLQQQQDRAICENNVIDKDNLLPNTLQGSNTDMAVPNDMQQAKQRRCIGRKPITDYKVGQYYSGSVVYARPFGIFLDIGCHYDAFCHVSQLSDTFVNNPIDTFPVGTNMDQKIRITEIDRKKKRITVTLIKQGKDQDVGESIDTPTTTKDVGGAIGDALQSTIQASCGSDNNGIPKENIAELEDATAMPSSNHENKADTSKARILSPVEQLKRDRKLARRAQRREAGVTNS